jgi:hypothetical protein
MTHSTRTIIMLLLVLLLGCICPVKAWTPFLNNYNTPKLERYQSVQQQLLDQTHERDISIADTINEFILYRLQEGQYSSPTGHGFPYSSPPSLPYHQADIYRRTTQTRWTPFDRESSLYAQKQRFPEISYLARQRLEMQGFRVQKLQIFENGRGVYIKWDIFDPTIPPPRNGAWDRLVEVFDPHLFARRQNYGYHNGGYTYSAEDACQGQSQELCRLQQFFENPLDFLRNR